MDYLYHSPEGDRPLAAKAEPIEGRVDLYNAKGELEIGNCAVEAREGGCTPFKASKTEKK